MRKFEFTIVRVVKEFYSYEMDKPLSAQTLQSIVKDKDGLRKHKVTEKELYSNIVRLSEVPALQRPRKFQA